MRSCRRRSASLEACRRSAKCRHTLHSVPRTARGSRAAALAGQNRKEYTWMFSLCASEARKIGHQIVQLIAGQFALIAGHKALARNRLDLLHVVNLDGMEAALGLLQLNGEGVFVHPHAH